MSGPMDTRIVVDALVELASNEEKLADMEAAARRVRHRVRQRRELAAEYDQDAAESDDARADADRGVRRCDREIRQTESLLAQKRDTLVGLSDRRQHQALLAEIAALERRLERLETEGLSLLSAAEVESAEAEAARQQAEKLTPEVGAADVEDAELRDPARERACREEIARIVGLLPTDVARHVARLRQRGDRATAWCDNGGCTACGAQLTPQLGIAAARGRTVVRCATCVRYVVHRPWR